MKFVLKQRLYTSCHSPPISSCPMIITVYWKLYVFNIHKR